MRDRGRRGTRGRSTLDEAIFGIQPNVPVLHQVVTAQLAAARSGTQSTKTRAEVSGGGRKPFKQKGTGRARQGSERAPHFTGGGVALGPKPRSYRQRTPRKMIQLALRSALSDRAAGRQGRRSSTRGRGPTPSTKEARAALGALGLDGRVLVVLDRTDEDAYKSFRNLPGRPADPGRRAQRLRHPLQRLDRVHPPTRSRAEHVERGRRAGRRPPATPTPGRGR